MKKFSLYNIKSFEKSEEIAIKPLTFFVGRNSCGKSSLIRFPVLLSQTFEEDVATPLLLFGNMIDYGNYNDVVNKHSNESIGFSLEFGAEIKRWMRRGILEYNFRDFFEGIDLQKASRDMDSVVLDVKISKPDKKMVVQEVKLKIDEREVFEISLTDKCFDLYIRKCIGKRNKEDKAEYIQVDSSLINFYRFVPRFDEEEVAKEYVEHICNMKKEEKDRIKAIIDRRQRERIKESDRSVDGDSKWLSVYVSLAIVNSVFRGIIGYLNNYAREVSYVGPFRENPKRTYRDSESNYNDVGVRGENAGMLLRQDFQDKRQLLEMVSEWFDKAMGYRVDIEDIGNGLYSLVVKQKLDGMQEEIDNIIDVGYGISQVLPIVTQLLKRDGNANERYMGISDQKKTFIIEQPELHLHPAAQAELANLLVKSANVSRSRRILVETHSEHLIRKLQVLIADPEVEIDSDQVAFYYVEKDSKGNSYTKKMEIDKNGQFEEPWPTGFFDKSYELVSELLFANSKISE